MNSLHNKLRGKNKNFEFLHLTVLLLGIQLVFVQYSIQFGRHIHSPNWFHYSTAEKRKVCCCPPNSAGNFLFWSKFVSSTKLFATIKKEFPTFVSLGRTDSHTVCMRFFCFITHSQRKIVCYSVCLSRTKIFILLSATRFAVSALSVPSNFQ